MNSNEKEKALGIKVNGEDFALRRRGTTPADMRALPTPPIPDDHAMWRDVPDARDIELQEGSEVELADGDEFFSAPAGQPREYQVTIDRASYLVRGRKATGAELRRLPDPDVPADRDLWEDVPEGRDRKVADATVVRLRDGIRFFTVPGRITPGARA